MNRLPARPRFVTALLLALATAASGSLALAQSRTDAYRGLDGPTRAETPAPPQPRTEERRGGDERRGNDRRADERRSDERRADDRRGDERRADDRRGDDRRVDDRRSEGPRHGVDPGRRWPEPGRSSDVHRWRDGGHGLHREYPRPGWVVRHPPPRASVVYWGGVPYSFWDGVWYTPGPRGHVVVRPPYGVVIADRPAVFSQVTVAGIGYLYANGVYYREVPGGAYEVVPPPVDGSDGNALTVTTTAAQPRAFVYPARGQSAERQATDEYECHAWAVSQTGFDPTTVATGQRSTAGSDAAQRDNYQRARIACLEGRGYSVR